MTKEYTYKDNMEVMDHIINELMIVRTTQEIEGFDKALMITYLSMYGTYSPLRPKGVSTSLTIKGLNT